MVVEKHRILIPTRYSIAAPDSQASLVGNQDLPILDSDVVGVV